MSTFVPEYPVNSPVMPSIGDFNPSAQIPFGVSIEHICQTMKDFTEFLSTVDSQLIHKNMTRLEEMLMPANFSSMVGEFIATNLPNTARPLQRMRITTAIQIFFQQENTQEMRPNMLERMELKLRRPVTQRVGKATMPRMFG